MRIEMRLHMFVMVGRVARRDMQRLYANSRGGVKGRVCHGGSTKIPPMPHVPRAPFGRTREGRAVEIFSLSNAHGLEVRIINYGGIVVSLRAPDRTGRLDDIVLGHDTLDGYLEDNAYLGALIGRCASRIARGRFLLDGVRHELATNDGRNHLHGGRRGFDKVVWDAEPFVDVRGAGVVLWYQSRDGEEGYPGALLVRVTYTLTDRDELVIDYSARTNRATPLNLTHHSYFNLAGAGARDVLDHVLTVNADRFTPTDDELIPTGEISPVDGTPHDFRQETSVGQRMGAGYDHNFVLNRSGAGLVHAAQLFEPTSGRTMDVSTTEPALQLYTGNKLDGSIKGKAGRAYGRHFGLCLEPQHFPDSPNRPAFPSTILRPEDEFRSLTVLAFGVR
jgi:aldose 1-epimerase